MNTTARAMRSLRPGKSTISRRKTLGLREVRAFVSEVYGDDLHAMRVLSLANGVVGVLHAALLSVHAIGQAYAKVAEITPKSGTKQVDRLLSNDAMYLAELQRSWVKFTVGNREEIVLAIDWTDFDKDDHTTLCAYLVSSHGRATPLAWRTVNKSQLEGRRTEIEHTLVRELDAALPDGIRVTALADRGFGDQKLYALFQELDWQFVVRFRGLIQVATSDGESRAAHAWLTPSGRARMLKNVLITGDKAPIPAIVVVHDKRMKEPWFLATSLSASTASAVVLLYGRRFTIEETFRDTKDLHFGMGLSATHIKSPARRDRLLLLIAMAQALLTLLGAASESAGLDRILKVNTVKKRTHSLYRQGHYWYHAIPYMREEWLRSLMTAFDRIVREQAVFRHAFGIV